MTSSIMPWPSPEDSLDAGHVPWASPAGPGRIVRDLIAGSPPDITIRDIGGGLDGVYIPVRGLVGDIRESSGGTWSVRVTESTTTYRQDGLATIDEEVRSFLVRGGRDAAAREAVCLCAAEKLRGYPAWKAADPAGLREALTAMHFLRDGEGTPVPGAAKPAAIRHRAVPGPGGSQASQRRAGR